ncbi:MAG: dihydrodipicolinate synthase family protein [Pseudomonadota bacterium]|nr:dihydrodipicolinate synthase family protein [Pseudomonadota bacterium]
MSLIDEKSRGVFAIAVTPFTEDGVVDFASVDSMVEFYLESGCSGLTILGVMGEAPKLTAEEAVGLTRRVIKRAGNTPVVVGVSGPAFSPMRALTNEVMDIGAAGVMIAPMAGLNTDQKIESYFRSVTELLGKTPIVLQDYPPSNGVYFSTNLLVKLFNDLPTLRVLKHEDWPGLQKVSEFRGAEVSANIRRISILVGNGGLFLPQELQRGVDGAMTGFAFPDMLVRVVKLHAEGKEDEAEDLFDAYLPLCKHEQQVGIGLAIRKETLRRRGVIRTNFLRSPGPTLDSIDQAELTHLINRLYRRLEVTGDATEFLRPK